MGPREEACKDSEMPMSLRTAEEIPMGRVRPHQQPLNQDKFLRLDRKTSSCWKGRIALAVSMPGFGNFKAKSRECAKGLENNKQRMEVEAYYVPEESDDTGNNSTGHVLSWTPAPPYCHCPHLNRGHRSLLMAHMSHA